MPIYKNMEQLLTKAIKQNNKIVQNKDNNEYLQAMFHLGKAQANYDSGKYDLTVKDYKSVIKIYKDEIHRLTSSMEGFIDTVSYLKNLEYVSDRDDFNMKENHDIRESKIKRITSSFNMLKKTISRKVNLNVLKIILKTDK